MKSILELNQEELKDFLLKHESYINIDLPPYLNFTKLLTKLKDNLDINSLTQLKKLLPEEEQNNKRNKRFQPMDLENVNYKLLHNKNGKYDWRQFELIHPVLYVSLVKEITNSWIDISNKFSEIHQYSLIQCMSLPVISESESSDKAEQILNWWEHIEQKSLELSLDFSHVYHTDITDCYGSIYTHSIPWALHTKEVAKEKRNDSTLIGNKIDMHIQAMTFGQTNGIPQGSILMDFIAEIVLAYADLELSKKLKELKLEISSFKIIRYRDDYRVFVNNTQVADEIIKNLSEVLIELGLKLHSHKTISSNNVIQSSVKQDKLDWLTINKNAKTIQKRLLIIHKFSLKYPNSGTLDKELQNILILLQKNTNLRKKENLQVLVSIIVDIAFLNPRTYSICIALISSILVLLTKNEAKDLVTRIITKFKTIPNTGHMQIWLQRAIIKLDLEDDFFDEKICKLVSGHDIKLWNNDWLINEIEVIFNQNKIFDKEKLAALDTVIRDDEVLLFGEQSL